MHEKPGQRKMWGQHGVHTRIVGRIGRGTLPVPSSIHYSDTRRTYL